MIKESMLNEIFETLKEGEMKNFMRLCLDLAMKTKNTRFIDFIFDNIDFKFKIEYDEKSDFKTLLELESYNLDLYLMDETEGDDFKKCAFIYIDDANEESFISFKVSNNNNFHSFLEILIDNNEYIITYILLKCYYLLVNVVFEKLEDDSYDVLLDRLLRYGINTISFTPTGTWDSEKYSVDDLNQLQPFTKANE